MKNLNTSGICKNSTVIVGLSGGADSVCLAHMLKFCELDLRVVACHINHNLRGEESLRDMNFVREFCANYNIELYIKDVQIKELAKIEALSDEECGRKVRYAFFDEIAKKFDNALIATAHSLSDTCETVIFNMTRGTGLKGLCGIPKERVNIVRPIINMTRKDVEAYCTQNNLAYVVDSTNLTCDYTRNKIRHIVVDCLKKINPSFENNVNRMVSMLEDDCDYIDSMAKLEFEKLFSDDSLETKTFVDMHKSISSRVVKLFLERFEVEVSNKLIGNLLKTIALQKGKINVDKDRYIVLENEKIKVFTPKIPTEYFENSLKDGKYASKTGKIYKIQTLETKQSKIINKIYKNLFDISLDCGKICGSVVLRQRRNGDSIKLYEQTKSLKKLFNEKHIPVEQRDKLFIVEDENGIVAIEGIGIAKRVKCDNETKKYINISEIESSF